MKSQYKQCLDAIKKWEKSAFPAIWGAFSDKIFLLPSLPTIGGPPLRWYHELPPRDFAQATALPSLIKHIWNRTARASSYTFYVPSVIPA